VTLKRCPPIHEGEIDPRSHWTAEKIAQLEKVLFELTGEPLEEIFPAELRHNNAFLSQYKTVEQLRHFEPEDLLAAAEIPSLLPSPEEVAIHHEKTEVISKVLRTLSERERKIVALRFGLDGQPACTLGEVGKVMGTTRERVRQIEMKAIRKLRHGERHEALMPLLECQKYTYPPPRWPVRAGDQYQEPYRSHWETVHEDQVGDPICDVFTSGTIVRRKSE
jgi:RNA polymerase sigma factor (sigma-70 family)